MFVRSSFNRQSVVCICGLKMPEKDVEEFRARSHSTKSYFVSTGLKVTTPLARCDRSENDLESFIGGMPSVENSWIDKRALSHR